MSCRERQRGPTAPRGRKNLLPHSSEPHHHHPQVSAKSSAEPRNIPSPYPCSLPALFPPIQILPTAGTLSWLFFFFLSLGYFLASGLLSLSSQSDAKLIVTESHSIHWAPLCSRLCSRCWAHNSDQDRHSASLHRPHSLVGADMPSQNGEITAMSPCAWKLHGGRGCWVVLFRPHYRGGFNQY